MIVKIKNRDELSNSEVQFFQNFGTVFHSDKFLSAIDESYHYIIAETKENQVVGAIPLVKTKKWGLKAYHIPPYAYQCGPVIHHDYMIKSTAILNLLLDHLPPSGHYDFKFFIANGDVLPFVEKGWSVSVNQTHVYPRNLDFGLSNLKKDKKRDVTRLLNAVDEGNLRVNENDSDNIDKILHLWKMTGNRSRFNVHTEKVNEILKSDLSFYTVVIEDKDGNPISGAFCPFDKFTMYHLIGANIRVEDSLFSRSNILSLYLSILKSKQMDLEFDCEGSNVPGVANFYRMMGGQPKLVFRAQKSKSIYYQLLRTIQQVLKERK